MPENIGDTITYNGQVYAVTHRETEYAVDELPRTTLHIEPVQEMLRTGDTDGDTEPTFNQVGTIGGWTIGADLNHETQIAADTLNTIFDRTYNRTTYEFELTDRFKNVLKPFMQDTIKELLEQEGFIVGRLPKEGESA